MEIIIKEDNKSFRTAAIFLICTGIWIAIIAAIQHNYNSLILGITFTIVSVIAYWFIHKRKLLTAKLIWAFATPVLIVFSCLVFPVVASSVIVTYGYALIGASAYVYYSFSQEENKIAYMALALFTLVLALYDTIIYKNAVRQEDYRIYTEFYLHLKFNQMLHFISIMYLVHIVRKNKFTIQRQLSDKIVRLREFTEQLIVISKNKTVCNGFLEESLFEIAKYTSMAADVSRVSVWQYSEEKDVITYLAGYNSLKDDTFKERELPLSAFQSYKTHLLEEKIIRTQDAVRDERTHELKEYLDANHIVSMMDCPIFLDGKFIGILCCEEQRGFKEWDEVDQLFCQAMTQLVAVAYYSCSRQEFYNKIALLNKQLVERNKVLTDVNTMIKSASESSGINLGNFLSDTESIKAALSEYSYKNSHQVRGPLSRILGLLSLYKRDESAGNRSLYIDHIEKSAQELDEIIKEMTLILSTENNQDYQN